jgi:CheY-like chemotaxis protein
LEEQLRQSQKMEAIGQLAGGVAHDFNNLLTVINGYCDLLLTSLPTADPARESVAEILSAGERSAALTRQLLAFSRKAVVAPRAMVLNAVIAGAEKLLRRLIGSDVRLTATLAPELWPVLADPGQIEQVLLNLVVNARDAMPTGGRLTIETRNIELDAGYAASRPDTRPGPYVMLTVTDTGTGMPPDVLARVFEPFFTTKPPGKGTGLGLATVYGIVKQSGGHLALSSEVGIGTTFKIYMPRAEQAANTTVAAPPPAAPKRGTGTVLVAEDDAAVRLLARRILAKSGYTVLDAATVEEADRQARLTDQLDLLVTDVVMPDGGGRAVAERVTKRHPGVKVLYVSGYTDDAVVRHGVLREGMHFLQKPFTAAALAGKVREVLDAPLESATR